MRIIRLLVGVAAAASVAGTAAACGPDADSLCEFSGTCGLSDDDGGLLDATTDGPSPDGTMAGDSSPPADGSGDASDASDASPPPTCDFAVDPVEALCVTDALGVFVSPTGTAGGAGTKEAPVSTIAKGIALATSSRSHVYVCTGMYAESVTISGASAVSLQGGFDCSSWAYAATNKVTVAPASGTALMVNEVTSAVEIEDVEFDAAAGTPTSVNSIAALVNASPSVTLRRVVLTAAAGGTPANPAAPATNHTTDALDGHAAGASGPAGTMCKATCGDATTTVPGACGGDNGDESGRRHALARRWVGGREQCHVTAPVVPSATGDGAAAPSLPANTSPAHAGTLTSTGWTPMRGASRHERLPRPRRRRRR